PVWVTTQRRAGFEYPGEATAESLLNLVNLGIDGVLVNDVALARRVFDGLTERPPKGIKTAT
ncbi:MAG TPA: hypothetical protein DIS76_07130, partial [Rhodospirillaceae bacterium]|nr:hypothetical protein [Rhodospirillaceae bacterium]